MKDFQEIATGLRRDVIKMLHRANGSFGGSAMSCVDILAVLYHGVMRIRPENPYDPARDMFFLSKGYAGSALYAVLASVGMIGEETLESYAMNGTSLIIHPKRMAVPGVEASAGSLGHGLALATGSALAARIMHCDANAFVLMGDGELNEGSVWENAAFAASQKLNNLVVIVDRNGLQGCGRDVVCYGDVGEKFRAFGFQTFDIDGHDYAEIEAALKTAVSRTCDKPAAIIAKTVKGRGVSFMEDKLEWHYKSPSDEQLRTALEELAR